MKSRLSKVTLFSIILIFSTVSLFSQETKIRVIKEDAVLRLKPNNESLIIRELLLGSVLEVEETIGEWIKVKLPPDEDGIIITAYIHGSFVEFEIKPPQATQKIKPTLIVPPAKVELPEKELEEGLISWRKKLAYAKSKKKTGDTAGIIGSVIGGLGTALYFTDLKEDIDVSYDPWTGTTTTTTTRDNKDVYILVSLGGAIISIIGFVVSEPAKKEIRTLELEGAKKGYIMASLTPIKGGLAFRLRFSF